jgi:hypothetical protein
MFVRHDRRPDGHCLGLFCIYNIFFIIKKIPTQKKWFYASQIVSDYRLADVPLWAWRFTNPESILAVDFVTLNQSGFPIWMTSFRKYKHVQMVKCECQFEAFEARKWKCEEEESSLQLHWNVDEEKRTHNPEVELQKYQVTTGVKSFLHRKRQINVSQHSDATLVSAIYKTRNSILELKSEYNIHTSMEWCTVSGR